MSPKPLSDDERAALLVRRVAGAFSCLLIGPGAGQLAMGHRVRALIWFIIAIVTVIPGPIASIWLFYASFPLRVISGIEVLLLKPPPPRSDQSEPSALATLPRWPAVIGLWCALMAAAFGLKLGAPHLYMGLLVSNATMSPVARPRELVLVNRIATAKIGDVVAYEANDKAKSIRLARLLATAGGRVEIKGGVLSLGDHAQYRKSAKVPCAFRDVVPGKKKGDAIAFEDVKCHGFYERVGGHPFWGSEPLTAKDVDVAARTVAAGHALLRFDNRAARDGRGEAAGLITVRQSQIVGVATAIWKSASQEGLRWKRLGAQLTWPEPP